MLRLSLFTKLERAGHPYTEAVGWGGGTQCGQVARFPPTGQDTRASLLLRIAEERKVDGLTLSYPPWKFPGEGRVEGRRRGRAGEGVKAVRSYCIKAGPMYYVLTYVIGVLLG